MVVSEEHRTPVFRIDISFKLQFLSQLKAGIIRTNNEGSFYEGGQLASHYA